MKTVNVLKDLETLKGLIAGNSNISFMMTDDDFINEKIEINTSERDKSYDDDDCSLGKCRYCMHRGMCDLQDGLEYEE